MRPSYDNHAATIALRWPEHADPPAEGPAAPVACETSEQYHLIDDDGSFVEGDADDPGMIVSVSVYFDAATAWLVGAGELVGGDKYYTTVSVDSGPGWADRLDEEIRGYGFDSVRFML